MARDFVHTAEIVDAVITSLTSANNVYRLPANWFAATRDGKEEPLKLCEHGDLLDYVVDDWQDLCPAILVRGTGTQKGEGRQGGDAAILTRERVRILHVRQFEQCFDDNGLRLNNMSRARERYSKIISKSIFADDNSRLGIVDSIGTRTDVTLTTVAGCSANIVASSFVSWDLGQGEGGADEVNIIREVGAAARLWAIALDLDVTIRTGA